jgi:glycosyltransferase involved in cell wall biosynthesis
VSTGGARVSAIIPVHNGAAFLADAVQSVLDQTRPVAECVVVDDGSTDGTAEVLRSFGAAVKVVRQPQGGVAAARNAGMEAASGDVFAFLDADDVWLPHKLDRQLSALAENPTCGAFCSGYVMTDSTLEGRRGVLVRDGVTTAEPAMLLEGPGIGFSFTGVVTREAAQAAGPFDGRLSTSADLEYAWRVATRSGLVAVREPLALYRQHGGGQMHHDLVRLEHDMALLWADAERAGMAASTVRRGRANLQTYLGMRLLLAGDTAGAIVHLRVALELDRRRVLLHPLGAVARRVHQDLAARRWARLAPGPGIGAPLTVTPPR